MRVSVELTPDERALLSAEAARLGQPAGTVLRDAFLHVSAWKAAVFQSAGSAGFTEVPESVTADFPQRLVSWPARGDDVEAWLKRRRDEESRFGSRAGFRALGGLLDEYRLHADTGTRLDDNEGGRAR